MLFACALAPALRAQEAPLDVRSLPEWFGSPGLPGSVDDLHMGSGLPMSWMGLIAGGVRYRDGLLPAFAPWPGLDEVASPLAWYDSAAVAVGEDAAWNGFSASLVELPFTYVNAARGCRRRGGRENVRSSTSEAEKPFHAASSPTATAAESYQASGEATSSSPGHGANAGRSPSR